MERKILHIDVNNAFLSWTAVEMLKNGYSIDIRTIPSIIGGDETKRSGIVLAKSTKAKEVGVRTADTIYEARRKCPNIRIYKSNYKIYKKYSDMLYELFLEYTDKVERYSIDECFLDMTNYLMEDTIENKALEISNRVKRELGFTVNVGIANNKLLAKMASDFEKPDRIHTLYKEEIKSKMWPLPVSELFMLGKKTVPKLLNMQIKTIGDLAHSDKNRIIEKFGKHGKMIWEYANGIDDSAVQYIENKPKCISREITLSENTDDINKIEEILLVIAEQITYQLRKSKLFAQTVGVKLRTSNFEDLSHQGKLSSETDITKIIYAKGKELVEELYHKPIKIRQVGLRVDNLVEQKDRQISLFEDGKNEKQEKLDKVLDALKDKYGYNKIMRAGSLKEKDMLNRK